jgi:hypothetical protein
VITGTSETAPAVKRHDMQASRRRGSKASHCLELDRNVNGLLHPSTHGTGCRLHVPTVGIKNGKVKLFLCLTNSALRHEGVYGRGCIDLNFLDLGTSWR